MDGHATTELAPPHGGAGQRLALGSAIAPACGWARGLSEEYVFRVRSRPCLSMVLVIVSGVALADCGRTRHGGWRRWRRKSACTSARTPMTVPRTRSASWPRITPRCRDVHATLAGRGRGQPCCLLPPHGASTAVKHGEEPRPRRAAVGVRARTRFRARAAPILAPRSGGVVWPDRSVHPPALRPGVGRGNRRRAVSELSEENRRPSIDASCDTWKSSDLVRSVCRPKSHHNRKGNKTAPLRARGRHG